MSSPKSPFFLGFFLATTLLAQTASIDGVVTDQTNAAMPGVRIVVTNLDTGLRRETESTGDGHFTVPLLPVGRYKLTASKAGFSNAERTDITLNVQQVARIDLVMQTGPVLETVRVSATAAILDSETSTVGQIVDN